MKAGMVSTRTPSTWNSSYIGIIRRYRAFCAGRTPPRVPVPADPVTVCLFLQLISSEAKSYASVKSASGALFTWHELALVPLSEIPTKHPLAKGIREAAKRRIGLKLVNQKESLEGDVLRSGILLYVPDAAIASLVALTSADMVSTMWTGFLRYKGTKFVWVPLVKLYETHMEMLLIERNNDQFRFGDVVCIARGQHRPSCPVYLCETLISRAGFTGMVNLFQGWDGRLARFHLDTTPLNGRHTEYPQCRAVVHKFLQRTTGMSATEVQTRWGTQSSRSGGATTAAKQADFRLF
eukprot:gene26871-biopygen27823